MTGKKNGATVLETGTHAAFRSVGFIGLLNFPLMINNVDRYLLEITVSK